MKFDAYRRFFSVGKFWKKLTRFARAAGTRTVYTSLLLYYAYEREETPAWARRIVLGALGYFLMPLDLVPDLSPVIGYTDDLGVLGIALVTIAGHINQEVKARAREKLTTWFPEPEEADIRSVDERL